MSQTYELLKEVNGTMLAEAELDKLDKLAEIKIISYSGISCPCDIALYNDYNKLVLLSFYGSMSQVKAIFSAVTQNYSIRFDNPIIYIRRSHKEIKFKTWKIGHGKYHAIIYDNEYQKNTILIFDEDQEAKIKAWKQFLSRTKIPILDEWIPKLISKLYREGHISTLQGHGASGYSWSIDDNNVCDLIVEEIYTVK